MWRATLESLRTGVLKAGVLTAGVLAAFFAPVAALAQQSSAFDLINGSQMVIQAVNISAANAEGWGRDWLGEKVVLNPGQKIRLDPGTSAGCIYDIRVLYAGNKAEERRKLDLCKVDDVTFNGSAAVARTQGGNQAQGGQPGPAPAPGGGQTGGAPNPDFKVANRSNKVMSEIYVSAVNQENWGEDRLPGTLAPGGEFVVKLPRNGQCEYDVRVVYEDKTTEERRRQNVCKLELMAFNGQGAQAPRPGQQAGTPPQPPKPAPGSFGTGFFVTAMGHALTNNHVIDGCKSVGALIDGQFIQANVVRKDERNDLALLRVQVAQQVPFAKFRGGSMARPGDAVVVAGFPLPSVLQNGLNVTVGNVSSLAGMGGNTALVQITAPVQPGNSGGPLFDMSGTIIGVVVSKLNAQRIAQATGDIPQNINFAVHGSVARLFVESTGQRTQELPATKDLRAGEVGDLALQFTIQIECRN